jgi:hypothetical protein
MVSKWNSGHPETPCGKGSLLSETKLIREILPKIISRYEVSTIADVGCGDQNWIKHTELKDAEYFGFDVEIIPGNKYRSVPEPFDLLTDILPRPFDLIMCIYVLNHLYGPGDVDGKRIKVFAGDVQRCGRLSAAIEDGDLAQGKAFRECSSELVLWGV